MSVLVLGGTAEARELAMVSAGPRRWLREHAVRCRWLDVDPPRSPSASRPTPSRPRTAAGVPLLRLERPGWSAEPGADGVARTGGHDEAALVAADLGKAWLMDIYLLRRVI